MLAIFGVLARRDGHADIAVAAALETADDVAARPETIVSSVAVVVAVAGAALMGRNT